MAEAEQQTFASRDLQHTRVLKKEAAVHFRCLADVSAFPWILVMTCGYEHAEVSQWNDPSQELRSKARNSTPENLHMREGWYPMISNDAHLTEQYVVLVVVALGPIVNGLDGFRCRHTLYLFPRSLASKSVRSAARNTRTQWLDQI